MSCEHEWLNEDVGPQAMWCRKCSVFYAAVLVEQLAESRAREARLRSALDGMRTVFAQNRHAQEWADYIERELASSADAPAKREVGVTCTACRGTREECGTCHGLAYRALHDPLPPLDAPAGPQRCPSVAIDLQCELSEGHTGKHYARSGPGGIGFSYWPPGDAPAESPGELTLTAEECEQLRAYLAKDWPAVDLRSLQVVEAKVSACAARAKGRK